MAQQLANGKQQFIDGNGAPLAGGSVAFYAPGTLNPVNTYQDSGLTTPNTNPVTLDASGSAVIWGADATLYRQIVKDALGNTIWDEVIGLDLQASAIGTADGSTLAALLTSGIGHVVDSVADMVALNPAQYTRAFATGYYAAADGGGGPYTWVAGATPNGVTLLASTFVGAPAGAWELQHNGRISLKQAGAYCDSNAAGTTGNDDTTAVQALFTLSATLPIEIWHPGGYCKISAQIVKLSSFNCPNLRGPGGRIAQFVYPGLASGVSAFYVQGGSGAICGAEWSGIGFVGASGTNAVEIDGQCGVTLRKMYFGTNAIGLLLHNKTAGAFTEYCVAEECNFDSTCDETLVYRRTGGNDSFHGSGLRNCTITEATTKTTPNIRIGGTDSTNNEIIVYNAPLSFQVWKKSQTPVLQNNSTRYDTTFHGDVTMEVDYTPSGVWYFANDSVNTYLAGNFLSSSASISHGTLLLIDRFEALSDGTPGLQLKPYRNAQKAAVSGANTVCSFLASANESYLVTVTFQDSASPAVKKYLLLVGFYSTVSGVLNLGQSMDNYGGNMPYPTFSMSGNSLVATAAFATTVSFESTVTQVEQSVRFAF